MGPGETAGFTDEFQLEELHRRIRENSRRD